MTALADFLRRASAEPFVYGEWDCAMFMANWVREQTGRDPAEALRGAYSGETGWRRIVLREGGLRALVGSLARTAGLVEIDPATAMPGDVGVVRLAVGEAGGIRVEGGWAVKVRRSVAMGPADALAAWRVP